jgi:hypothetical protein
LWAGVVADVLAPGIAAVPTGVVAARGGLGARCGGVVAVCAASTARRGGIAALWLGVVTGLCAPEIVTADEFLALPGLWKTTYEIQDGASGGGAEKKVVWRCVDEAGDPWVSFAQLRDLPGMTCARLSLQFQSTSLKWKTECRGARTADSADVIRSEGAIVFDSPTHYTGWVRFSGTLMGYPVESRSSMEGSREAACTSPAD